jgi:tetratricopeptide (TPR) repeat protein
MKEIKFVISFILVVLLVSCTTGEMRREKQRDEKNAAILAKSVESTDQPFVDGKKLLSEEKYSEALQSFEKSSYSQSFFYRAMIHVERDEIEKAKELLEKSIEKNSLKSESYYNLALIAFDEGNAEKSEEFILKSLKISPDHVPSLYFAGNLRFMEMKYDEALNYYNKAIKKDPGKTELWDAVFAVRLQQEEWEECWKIRDKVELSNTVILSNLLKIGQNLQKYDEAEKLIPSNMKKDPEINQELRVVLTRSGKLKEAIAEANSIVASTGGDYAILDRGGSDTNAYIVAFRNDSALYLICAKDPQKELLLTIDGDSINIAGQTEHITFQKLSSFSKDFCQE